MVRKVSLAVAAALLLLAWTGCTAILGGGGTENEESNNNAEGAPTSLGADDTHECQDCAAPIAPHLVRLTHAQWGHAVRDIFELDTVPSVASTFSLDSVDGRFSTAQSGLRVHQNLWVDYERAAEAVAAQITAPAVLDALAPDRDPQLFLRRLGRRCYRRPLDADELGRFHALFDLGPEIIASGDAFADGAQLFARACLQSPHFLYRTELTETGPLSPFEIVSRLSFGLWETAPDDHLLDRAASGDLASPEALADLVNSMLLDPRARPTLSRFHSELLHFEEYADIVKDSERYPEFNAETPDYLVTESQMFLEEIIFERSGSYTDVLTTPETFVNANLAKMYGLDGPFGESFERVELDPTQRSGLLTRLGFLAKNADALEQDPIHRGVSIAMDITCTDIPSPPDNIELPDVVPGNTVRERVTAVTSPASCAGCHETVINPPGFAFGHYDGDGAYMESDGGQTVDASGEFVLDGQLHRFDNGVQFSEQLAASEQVHRCYAEHLQEFFYGRETHLTDGKELAQLARGSVSGEMGVLEVIRALLLRDRFLTREVSP